MCTEFGIKINDPPSVEEKWAACGRNMDWLGNTQNALFVPTQAGVQIEAKAPDGTAGIQWETTIGCVIGTVFERKEEAEDSPKNATEGFNNKGLSFSANMLDCTQYPADPPTTDYDRSLGITSLGAWILSQYASVDEVVEVFRKKIDGYQEYTSVHGKVSVEKFQQNNDEKIYLYQDTVFENRWKTPGLHLAIRDAEGKALIVEFLNGKVIGYRSDNYFTDVMTNDPILPLQVRNLANFNHLNNEAATPVEIDGQVIEAVGVMNNQGLPGDASPESRYVRVAEKIRFLPQPKNVKEALTAVMDIADEAKVTKNDAVFARGNRIIADQTIWQTFKTTVFKKDGRRVHKLYYRTNLDAQLKVINLTKLFATDKELKPIRIITSLSQTAVDTTSDFMCETDQNFYDQIAEAVAECRLEDAEALVNRFGSKPNFTKEAYIKKVYKLFAIKHFKDKARIVPFTNVESEDFNPESEEEQQCVKLAHFARTLVEGRIQEAYFNVPDFSTAYRKPAQEDPLLKAALARIIESQTAQNKAALPRIVEAQTAQSSGNCIVS